MKLSYTLRLFILAAVLALVTFAAQISKMAIIPNYNWMGLGYLVLITWLIHSYVYAASANPNSLIRRLMVASLLRMILGILFLAITLFNNRPAHIPFVIFYCSYFCVFMLFEILNMRTNLRPDLKQRPKNENA
jgi:hypothetical protein